MVLGKHTRKTKLLSGLVAALALSSCSLVGSDSSEDWALHGLDSQETRFSQLEVITTENVSQLGVAWFADLNARSLRGVEGTPIVVDGVMYATGPWSKVVALNAVTGERLWDYDPDIDGAWARRGCCDIVNRGVAYHDGKIFVGVYDGRLVALDAKTGKEVWTVQTTDKTKSYTISGAPRIVKDKVVIGNGGAEYGVRGYVTAYDTATGDEAWRFYTVPGNPADGFESETMEMAAETWSGDWWKLGGGGTAWDSMAYDPDLDLLYIGVGNGSPWDYRDRSEGEGDNLFLTSIVAVRPDTGEYVWHFQQVPGDEWDYTATQHMILADLEIDGEPRKVIMQAPKNGYFYVLDRETGEFISGEPYVKVTWAEGLDPETGRAKVKPEARYSLTGEPYLGFPSPAGGHNWQPMSYNPQTGLVYFTAVDMAYPYIAAEPGSLTYNERGWNTGQDALKTAMPEDPEVRKEIASMVQGRLMAWDPVKQEKAWEVPMTYPWNGGVLSTAGGLVFQGNGTGEFAAYDAQDGSKLWSRNLHSGIVAPPITYSVDGVQYVAVAVGWGGILTLNLGEFLKDAALPRVNRIVVFRLDGKAELPAPSEIPEAEVRLIPTNASTATVTLGKKLFHEQCWMCHGDTAVNRGGIPDLRTSAAITDADVFKAFVLEGVAQSRGMAEFKQELNEAEVEAIRAYVVKRANDLARERSKASTS